MPAQSPTLLLELADRCEASDGPDRALDTAIAVAIDYRWPEWEEGDLLISAMAAKHGLEWAVQRVTASNASIWRNLPACTASVDAAMTLVPEGWRVAALSENDGRRWSCELYPRHDTRNTQARAFAMFAPRALTAACLRARAAEGAQS